MANKVKKVVEAKVAKTAKPKDVKPVEKSKAIDKENAKHPLVGKLLGGMSITSAREVEWNGKPRQEVTLGDGSTYSLSKEDVKSQLK